MTTLIPVRGPVPFELLLWGVPICMTVHNLEEALSARRFLDDTAGLRPGFRLSRPGFLAVLAILSLTTWGVAAEAAREGPKSTWADVLVVVQAGLLLNALVPHLALSLRRRRYVPGLATALLLNVPFAAYLLWRRVASGC